MVISNDADEVGSISRALWATGESRMIPVGTVANACVMSPIFLAICACDKIYNHRVAHPDELRRLPRNPIPLGNLVELVCVGACVDDNVSHARRCVCYLVLCVGALLSGYGSFRATG